MSAPSAPNGRSGRPVLATLAAAAAVTVIALGAAAAPSLTQPGASDGKRVPFKAEPTTGGLSTAPPRPTMPIEAEPGLRACRPDDLQPLAVRQEGNAEGVLIEPAVRNTGPACALNTQAQARLTDSQGRPTASQPGPERGRGATTVNRMYVAPNAELRLRLIAIGAGCASLPRDGLQLRANVNATPAFAFRPARPVTCEAAPAEAEDQLTVGPWLPQLPVEWLREAPRPSSPYRDSNISVSISEAEPRPAGEEVQFLVTLKNAGETPFALEPCPSYRMFLIQDDAGVEQYHKLNCAATDGTIEPGESLAFEMLLRSDPALRGGTLGWQLGDIATPDAPQASVEYRSQ